MLYTTGCLRVAALEVYVDDGYQPGHLQRGRRWRPCGTAPSYWTHQPHHGSSKGMGQFNDGWRANVSQVVSCDALDLNGGIAFVEPSGDLEVTANGSCSDIRTIIS